MKDEERKSYQEQKINDNMKDVLERMIKSERENRRIMNDEKKSE